MADAETEGAGAPDPVALAAENVALKTAAVAAEATITTLKAEALALRAQAVQDAAVSAKALEIAARTGSKTGLQAPPAGGLNPVLDLMIKRQGLGARS